MHTSKHICADCIGEPDLRGIVEAQASSDYKCDFCADAVRAVPLSVVAEECDRALRLYYEESSQCDAVVLYERAPQGDDLHTTLRHLAQVSSHVTTDLITELEDHWPDDPWFIRRKSHDSPLMREWNQMEISLRNEARFFNPVVAEFMERIFGSIASDCAPDGTPVLVDAGPGTRYLQFFRARAFYSGDEMESALSHLERSLGAQQVGKGPAGRMNAAGQPAFYGATLAKTAVAEVRPPVGSQVAVGRFEVVRALKLLDLAALGMLELPVHARLFHSTTLSDAHRNDFLRALSEKMTLPVMPEAQDRDYLITQVVADYLAMHPTVAIDGILYPSVQVSEGGHAHDSMNVVLFHKAAITEGADSALPTAKASLWTSPDDAPDYFDPKILPQAPVLPHRNYVTGFAPEPTLRLDPYSIVIHAVRSVEVNTKPTQLRLVDRERELYYE